MSKMVLEHIFPENWLEQKAKYGFLLGVFYSAVGIGLSKILFPADPALVAVAFTSLLLLPELYKMFSIEERSERKEKKFRLRELGKDNSHFVKIYLSLFLGILLAYSLAAMFLPSFEVNSLFREQLEFRQGNLAGGAASQGIFSYLLINNFWVLIACFVISLLTGDGAIFLITWNASLWGTIFGVTARNAALFTQGNPFFYFLSIMVIVFPHVILEALAYILGAISGGVISKDVILEKFDSKRFNLVFKYNFVLFLLALLFLLAGVIVETYVLNNASGYANIIALSYS